MAEPMPKPRRLVIEEYLDFIRRCRCALRLAPFPAGECYGDTEPDHLDTRGARGADLFAVPLCSAHHAWRHQMGIETFIGTVREDHGVDLWEVAARLLAYHVMEEAAFYLHEEIAPLLPPLHHSE